MCRFIEAAEVNERIMVAVHNCYSSCTPVSVLLKWQLSKLLMYLENAAPQSGNQQPSRFGDGKSKAAVRLKCAELMRGTIDECECMYGSEHPFYLEMSMTCQEMFG